MAKFTIRLFLCTASLSHAYRHIHTLSLYFSAAGGLAVDRLIDGLLTVRHFTDDQITIVKVTVTKMTVVKMTVAKMTVAKMTVAKMTFVKMTVVKITVVKMTVVKVTVGKMTIGKMTIGKITIGKMTAIPFSQFCKGKFFAAIKCSNFFFQFASLKNDE